MPAGSAASVLDLTESTDDDDDFAPVPAPKRQKTAAAKATRLPNRAKASSRPGGPASTEWDEAVAEWDEAAAEADHAATAAAAEGYRSEDFDLGVEDWEGDSDEPASAAAPAAPANVAATAAERRECSDCTADSCPPLRRDAHVQ